MGRRRGLPVKVLAPLLVLPLLFSCNEASNGPLEGPDIGTLERNIRQDVPAGASLDDIRSYLTSQELSQGFEHGLLLHASDYSRLTEDYGLMPDTPIYIAVWRGAARHLTVVFVLSDDQRFEDLIILESFVFP